MTRYTPPASKGNATGVQLMRRTARRARLVPANDRPRPTLLTSADNQKVVRDRHEAIVKAREESGWDTTAMRPSTRDERDAGRAAIRGLRRLGRFNRAVRPRRVDPVAAVPATDERV